MKKVFLEEFAVMTSQKALLTSNMVKGDYIHLKGAVLSKFAKVMSTYCLKFMILCTIYFVHSFSDDITCKCPTDGLTDGEGTERLWSFLREFSRITKEMSPEKRIDTLTDALLHYGRGIVRKLGLAQLILLCKFIHSCNHVMTGLQCSAIQPVYITL